MGNRALITGKNSTVGIYLHWNGGMDSVKPFLTYASFHTSAGLGQDTYDSGLSTLVTIVNNFFGLGSTASIDTVDPEALEECSPGDNGVYVVDKNWDIIQRVDAPSMEQDSYDFAEMLEAIDEAQPENIQLGKKFLESKVIPVEDVEVGMTVFKKGYDGWEEHTVKCLGNPEKGEKVPGCYPDNTPYTGDYPGWNPNGYLLSKTVHAVV